MRYDKDLRWTRRLLLALLGMNLFSMVAFGLRHNWLNAVPFLIWSMNFLFMLRWTRHQQEWRDQRRILEAALQESLRISHSIREAFGEAEPGQEDE